MHHGHGFPMELLTVARKKRDVFSRYCFTSISHSSNYFDFIHLQTIAQYKVNPPTEVGTALCS
jgi:hypothetical protein